MTANSGFGRSRRFDRLAVLACFDSAACFAALLGTVENGRWLLLRGSGFSQ